MFKVKVQTQEYRMNMIAILQFQIPEYKDDQSPFFRRIVKNSWFRDFLKFIWERLFPPQVFTERRLPSIKMKIGAPRYLI